MTDKVSIFLAGLALLFHCTMGISAAAVSQKDFHYKARIDGQIKKNGLYGVVLGSNILRKSKENHPDIRIYSTENREIPYVILDNVIPVKENEKTPLEALSLKEENNSITITLRQKDTPKTISRMYLETENHDFHKNIRVSGSNDMKQWEDIGDDSIYDFSSRITLRKTFLTLKKNSFKYFKLVIKEENTLGRKNLHAVYCDGDLSTGFVSKEKLRIDEFLVQNPGESTASIVHDEEALTPRIVHDDKKKVTEVKIMTQLPFTSLDFIIDTPYYQRPVKIFSADTDDPSGYTLFGQMSLRNLSAFEQRYIRNRIEISPAAHHRYYKIVIENGANPPLKITRITARWIQKVLFFIGLNDNDTYTLYWDNHSSGQPAIYDISALIRPDNWFEGKPEVLKISVPVRNETFEHTPWSRIKPFTEKYVPIAVIIMVVLVIGFFLYRLWRNTRHRPWTSRRRQQN